jgi:exopolysaccharide biosynthesis polyprenyl glycosylphosphotransferase
LAQPGTVQYERQQLRLRLARKDRVKRLLQISLVGIDVAMLVLAFALGYYARATLPLPDLPVNDPPPFSRYLPMLAVHTLTIIGIFYFARMYHTKRAISRIDIGYRIAQNVSIGTFMAIAIETLAFKNSGLDLDYPRGVIIYAWVFSIGMVVTGREVHRQMVVRLRKIGIGRDRVLVVGAGRVASSIIGQIQRSPQFGYDVVGAVTKDDEMPEDEKVASGRAPILGSVDDLPRLIDTFQVDNVIIALPDAHRRELLGIINLCQRGAVDIKIFPDNFAFITSGLTIDDLGGVPLLGVRDIALRGWKLSLKRGLDIVGAFFGLIFLSPFLLLTAIIIYLTDRGPAFFSQERVGMDGKPFPMIKFRTMRVDAEQYGHWTTKDDPRKTRIGAFLRRTNWDELPNLINVLYGQMSLVGPRPEQLQFVEGFRQTIPRYMERHREKSGMTGWAQVNGLRGDTSIEERLKYDLYYVENWSLWFDIKIILRTIAQTVLLRNRNAY